MARDNYSYEKRRKELEKQKKKEEKRLKKLARKNGEEAATEESTGEAGEQPESSEPLPSTE